MKNIMSADPLVLFMPSGKRGRFPAGTPVLEAARQLGVYVESVCGRAPTCWAVPDRGAGGAVRQARHHLLQRHISARGPKEERYDKVRGLPENRRLSCSALIQGDLVIDVPQDTVVNAQVVRKAASDRVIERNPPSSSAMSRWTSQDMHKPLGDLDRLRSCWRRTGASRIC